MANSKTFRVEVRESASVSDLMDAFAEIPNVEAVATPRTIGHPDESNENEIGVLYDADGTDPTVISEEAESYDAVEAATFD